MDDITALDLCALAGRLARGDVSAAEVTDAYLARIARLQPRLNCYITIDAEGARAAAARADRTRAKGRTLGPLHGVPLAHKDLFHRAGRRCTAGSRILADMVPAATAPVLTRLDRAGAVDLGTLHLGEFAASGSGHNAHFGACVNPWNAKYTTGGSSSGPAAALAARLAAGALGTDTSGSVRWPAFACGVVGLRPTQGRIPAEGVFARSWSLDAVGPMARTVADCALLFAAAAGSDHDAAALERPLDGLRVGVATNYYRDGLDGAIAANLEESVAVFAALGARVQEISVPDPAPHFTLADLIVKAEAAALHGDWIDRRPGDYAPDVLSQLEAGRFIPAPRYIDALRLRRRARDEFVATAFARIDILHLPCVPVPTPTLAQAAPADAERVAAHWRTVPRCLRPISYLGLPALALPSGFGANGMPLGLQLVAAPDAEATLLRAGHLYQRETAWHERAPDL